MISDPQRLATSMTYVGEVSGGPPDQYARRSTAWHGVKTKSPAGLLIALSVPRIHRIYRPISLIRSSPDLENAPSQPDIASVRVEKGQAAPRGYPR